MRPFIEKTRELLQKADKALDLAERKLRIGLDLADTNPLLSIKTSGQAERHMEDYERAKDELMALWISEDSPVGERVDMVTISEGHNWDQKEKK